jgi:flagellar basal-body rod protein FlgF
MVMTEVDLPAEPGTKLAYVQDMASARDFSQGALRPTESPLDLAIDGKGFFAVRTPEGIRYTRVGRFQLDDNGVLVTSQGYPVLGGGSPLTLTPEDGPINVAADGTISTDRALEGQQLAIVGKLDLVDFADPARLTPAVDGFFVASQPARRRRRHHSGHARGFQRQADRGNDQPHRGDPEPTSRYNASSMPSTSASAGPSAASARTLDERV